MRNKAEGGSPIGLLERSAEYTEGAVFVSIAYRVIFLTFLLDSIADKGSLEHLAG